MKKKRTRAIEVFEALESATVAIDRANVERTKDALNRARAATMRARRITSKFLRGGLD